MNRPHLIRRGQRLLSALARRALWRHARAPADPHSDRVVILLSSAWGMGGTIRSALNLAGWLAERREVEIITPYRRRDEPFFGVFPAGVTVTALADERDGHAPRGAAGVAYRLLHRLPSVLYPRADRLHKNHSLWTDLQLVRRLRGQVGILIGTRPGLNVLISQLRLPGFRTVGLEQMHLANHRQRLRRAIARWYPGLDGLVTLTEQDAAEYEALLDRRLQPRAIPNTVRLLGGPEVDPAAPVVVAAGRLGRLGQKGFDLLLRAWAIVAQTHPDWRLRIYGDGPLRPELEAMVHELGLQGAVELPGATDDMGAAMAEASVYVLSSRYEGFPLILLEAMSKGLACVSFDCPTGPAEMIDDHQNALLAPAQDVEALAGAILELMGDEQLRRRLGAAARLSAEACTMKSIGPRWERFLDDLQARHPPRRTAPAGTATFV